MADVNPAYDVAPTDPFLCIAPFRYTRMSLPESLQALRVLIIDDDDFTVDVAEMLLRQLGVTRVDRANDGSVGLLTLSAASDPFDVVLCDLQMDGMDGIEVLRHLGEAGDAPALIFLSGSDERMLASVSALGRKHGLTVLGALRKPLSAEALRQALLLLEQPAVRGGERARMPVTAAPLTADEIRAGLAQDAVQVHLLPKVTLSESGPVGLECLLRWRDPVHGLLPPAAVIPVAEQHGLIHAITEQVFRRAITLLADLQREAHDVTISVNLSILDLKRLDLPELLVMLARETGVAPHRITLEIAEHPALLEVSVEQDVITRLALRGFALSIDDFGTGYASLQSLRNLPVQELKVDRAFVTGASHKPISRAILQSSVALGHQLGLRVVAEGVETPDDVALVRQIGCDAMQGDAIASPMSPEVLRPWLIARSLTLPDRRTPFLS